MPQPLALFGLGGSAAFSGFTPGQIAAAHLMADVTTPAWACSIGVLRHHQIAQGERHHRPGQPLQRRDRHLHPTGRQRRPASPRSASRRTGRRAPRRAVGLRRNRRPEWPRCPEHCHHPNQRGAAPRPAAVQCCVRPRRAAAQPQATADTGPNGRCHWRHALGAGYRDDAHSRGALISPRSASGIADVAAPWPSASGRASSHVSARPPSTSPTPLSDRLEWLSVTARGCRPLVDRAAVTREVARQVASAEQATVEDRVAH
ncbi:hypothetical protein QFZ43_005470 [Streptomyces afghaniensis]|nr:hypothetical protein [Streptomyces afghaniensis]